MIALVCSAQLASTMKLNCRYDYSLSNTYTCVATVSFEDDDVQNVTEISQNHIDGLSAVNVKSLQINNQEIAFMPRGVENFFPQLSFLRIFETKIYKISPEDLKLTELRKLAVHNGFIETLSSDIFKYAPKLNHINFSYNNLKHVSRNFLGSLTLNSAYFQGNPCINLYGENIAKIKRQLELFCPPKLDTQEIVEEVLSQKACEYLANCSTDVLTDAKFDSIVKKVTKMENDLQDFCKKFLNQN